MSVQRWDFGNTEPPIQQYEDGEYVRFADHARIVAEEVAAAVERTNDEWRSTGAWQRMRESMEQVHAAALENAEARARYFAARADEWHEKAVAAAPRTLTADDPEPAVRSVVLTTENIAYTRTHHGTWGSHSRSTVWALLVSRFGPLTLIHDGEATPQHWRFAPDDGPPMCVPCTERAGTYVAWDDPTHAAIDGEA